MINNNSAESRAQAAALMAPEILAQTQYFEVLSQLSPKDVSDLSLLTKRFEPAAAQICKRLIKETWSEYPRLSPRDIYFELELKFINYAFDAPGHKEVLEQEHQPLLSELDEFMKLRSIELTDDQVKRLARDVLYSAVAASEKEIFTDYARSMNVSKAQIDRVDWVKHPADLEEVVRDNVAYLKKISSRADLITLAP